MNRTAALALLGGGEQAAFIQATRFLNSSGSAGNVTISLAGLVATDFALIFAQGSSAVPTTNRAGGASPWTVLAPAAWTAVAASRVFYHVLDATDVVPGNITVNIEDQCGGMVLGYKHVTGAAVRTTAENTAGGTTLALPAFTLASATAGVLAILEERDGTTGFAPPAVGGLATRLAPAVAGINLSTAAYDFTVPYDYPEASMTWTGFNAGLDQMGLLLELLQ
jgi:hypothetical protein